MTGIELYSTTAASNNSAVPNGWPEGMAPSGVNDAGRQMMAAIRTWYEDAEWIKWGDTTAYVASTQFKIAGSNVTTRYTVGRRVRAVGSSTGTIYGIITASAFSTDTTVTVSWDSGSLSNESLTISIALFKNAAGSLSYSPYVHGADIASASTVSLDASVGDLVDVTGTTTITAITLREGREVTVRFTGILIVTNGASLALPTGANITTAAGDYFVFRGYASGVVRCVNYSPAAGYATSASITSAVNTAVAASLVGGAITGNLPTAISGSSTTGAVTVSAGRAIDSAGAVVLVGAGYSWAVSNGNAINGYQGGTTLPNSSTIHFFLCTGGSGTGTFASTSLSPTLPTGYTTSFRRIFSLNTTGAGALIPGTPIETEGGGVLFWLTTQNLDINGTTLGNSSRTLLTLSSLPTGIKVAPKYRVTLGASAVSTVLLTSGDETDVAAGTVGATTAPAFTSNNTSNSYPSPPSDDELTTNTSGQIGARANTGTTQAIYVVVRGWRDFRRS